MKTIHRDLKPGNILINYQGQVKLTDFGISKELVATANLSQTFVGTSAYMCNLIRSPERIEGQQYSKNSDVWSIGIIIIEMATGKNPYPLNASPVELVEWIVHKPVPAIPTNLGYSSNLQNFVNLWYNKLVLIKIKQQGNVLWI